MWTSCEYRNDPNTLDQRQPRGRTTVCQARLLARQETEAGGEEEGGGKEDPQQPNKQQQQQECKNKEAEKNGRPMRMRGRRGQEGDKLPTHLRTSKIGQGNVKKEARGES